MKQFYFLLIAILVTSISSFAQNKNIQHQKVELPQTEVLTFKSNINNHDYVLYVGLPGSYSDTTKKFPVLYVLDAQWSFPYIAGVQGIQPGLFYDGLIPEMIVVGIIWTGDYDANRSRDFTPTTVKDIPNSVGGEAFLNIIKNEIMTKIDSAYRTDKNNNALIGGSLGGMFTLYTMLQQPTLFNRYISWGAATDYDNGLLFKMEKSFAQKNQVLNAKLFISIGEYEEQVSGGAYSIQVFIKQLIASNYKEFDLESMVAEKMGHVSEGPYAVSRGLQFIFSKPELVLDVKLLNQYTGHYNFNDDSITITQQNNNLYITFPAGKIKLYASTNESFYAKGLGGGSVQFIKYKNNKVVSCNLIIGDNVRVYKKID